MSYGFGRINDLCDAAHKNAFKHGFWGDYFSQNGAEFQLQFRLARLALISSEVGEAVEAVRHADSENLAEELADICIRVFDLCGGLKINLEQAIVDKMEKNSARPHMHEKLA